MVNVRSAPTPSFRNPTLSPQTWCSWVSSWGEMDPCLHIACEAGGWGLFPPCAQHLPIFLFLWTPHPTPQHALVAPVKGSPWLQGWPARPRMEREGLPPSRPALCFGLQKGERGIVSQPGRHSLRFPRSDPVGGLWPSIRPAPIGDPGPVHTAWFECGK